MSERHYFRPVEVRHRIITGTIVEILPWEHQALTTLVYDTGYDPASPHENAEAVGYAPRWIYERSSLLASAVVPNRMLPPDLASGDRIEIVYEFPTPPSSVRRVGEP